MIICYRLRDLSAHEKHEAQKLQKELDVRRSEITELSHTKEKLSARQEEMEQQIADLQEQVRRFIVSSIQAFCSTSLNIIEI